MTRRKNLILCTDSYKMSHFLQYPEGLTNMEHHIESRGGRYKDVLNFGMQMYKRDYLTDPVTHYDVDEAKDFAGPHGEPFPEEAWRRIVDVHGGFMPVRIFAAPEGVVIPTRNIVLRTENTDEKIPWIAGWLETSLLRGTWYPTTVATKSLAFKRVIWKYLKETSDDPKGEIDFKVQDFGGRGVECHEAAGIGGCANLVNFKGSDTIEGILYAREYYGEPMAGVSIPASEHSTMTIRGRAGELEQMKNMIRRFGKPGALFACVSDSYDIYHAVEHYWCGELFELLENSGSTCVIRPDSGEAPTVNLRLAEVIARTRGTRTNMKGYEVFPKCLRLIQGDGNNDETDVDKVLYTLTSRKFSATNIGFGAGKGLLQDVSRDTQDYAMKCNWSKIDGTEYDVYKDPITQLSKASRRGRNDLIKDSNGYRTVPLGQGKSELQLVYENGKHFNDTTFAEVRARASQEFAL